MVLVFWLVLDAVLLKKICMWLLSLNYITAISGGQLSLKPSHPYATAA